MMRPNSNNFVQRLIKIVFIIFGIPYIVIIMVVVFIGAAFRVVFLNLLDRFVQPLRLRTLRRGKSSQARAQAAYQLGKANRQETVLPLITALGDESMEVRAAAAYALGFLADERAIPALERLCDNDTGIVSDGGSLKDIAAEAITSIYKGIRKPRTLGVENWGWL